MFWHTITVVGKTTCGVQSHLGEHLDCLKNFHLFVLHSLYNKEKRIEPEILCFHTKAKTSLKHVLAVHHTLVIICCNHTGRAKCDTDRIVSCCKVDVGDSVASICRVYDRFSLASVVYRNTSLDCFLVCGIQSKRNIVKLRLKELYCPFHKILAIVLSRSDVYIKICSACIKLLFCSFDDRLRISLSKCFVYCRCCC